MALFYPLGMLFHLAEVVVEACTAHRFEFFGRYVAAQIVHFSAFGGIFDEVERSLFREGDIGGAILEAVMLYELNSLFHRLFFLLFIDMRLEFEHHIDVGTLFALLEIGFERWQIFAVGKGL